MHRPDASHLASKLRDGSLDPVDLVDDIFDRIAKADDQSVFIELLPKRARREAEAARKRLRGGAPLSALDGVPIGWKDLFDIEGRVTLAGSTVLQDDPPAAADADLVAAGARAGLVSVGTLNMTEFAYSGIGLNPHYGTPANPNGTDRARSGRLVLGAVSPSQRAAAARDRHRTGGSIRIPASFNGMTGYKSSTRPPRNGWRFPLSRSLDSSGRWPQRRRLRLDRCRDARLDAPR